MSQTESEFDKLPIEMQRKLFSYLPYEDNLNARQVCASWCDLVDENLLFNVQLDNETLENVENLNRPIENLTVVNLTREISFDKSIRTSIGTSVVHLILGQWITIKSKCSIISQDNVIALLTALNQELESVMIFVRQLHMKDLSLFNLISLQRVTKFDVIVRHIDEMDTFVSILKIHLPILQSLRIDWDKLHMNSVEKMLPLYKEIYSFVADQNKLKFLHLILPFHWIDRRQTKASSSNLDSENFQIEEKLKQLELVEVTLRGLPVEGSRTFKLGMTLLNAQKMLTHIHLYDLKVGYYYKLKTLFQNCCFTLVYICIEGASLGAYSYGQFSCSLFKSCTNLRTLIINNSQITQMTDIEHLPKSLSILNLKMPIDGTLVYPWIAQNLINLKELTIRPTLWNVNAVMDLGSFKKFLALPFLLKLNLSDGLFESQGILQFIDETPGLNAVSASYCWPDLVNLYVLIDRNIYKHFY